MKNFVSDMSQLQAVTALRILYPIWTVVGMFSLMYVSSSLIIDGDAVATANNIMANELLFRMGIVGSLIVQLIHIAVVLVLYQLFKTVDKNMSLLLMVLGLVGVPIAMLNELNQLAALEILNGGDFLKLFDAGQLQALALFFLNLNHQGVFIAQIFWGLWLFPLGCLVNRSGFFPKFLGVLLTIAGIGYVLDSFTRFIWPKAAFLSLINVLMYGEVIFMLWVLIKGAKLPKMKF